MSRAHCLNGGTMKTFKLLLSLALLQISLNTGANSTSLTFDLSHYYYDEPNFMNDESDPFFVSAGIKNWTPKIDPKNEVKFLYTLEGTSGSASYTSVSTGTLDKDYYKFRGEAYLGYGLGFLTPFIGLGYRWLYDDSGGQRSSTGAFSYDRKSEYVYLPIGAVLRLNKNVLVKGNVNYLLNGTQTSYLSDVPGFTDIENDQTSGWGTDITVDYALNEKFGMYLFSRYWDIDKSDTATGTFANVLIFQAFEPANTTTEYGIGFSYRF
mgnify:CR=1 FL=1